MSRPLYSLMETGSATVYGVWRYRSIEDSNIVVIGSHAKWRLIKEYSAKDWLVEHRDPRNGRFRVTQDPSENTDFLDCWTLKREPE